MLKLILSIWFSMLSLVLRIAAKLRLTIPVLYLLAIGVSTVFTDWAAQHEQQILWGLYAQLALVALSWIFTAANALRSRLNGDCAEDDIAWQLRRARELGVRWTVSASTVPTTSSIPERGCP